MGRIPAETIERVLAATDIVVLVGSYFPLKRAGSTYRALCPFHEERTPSFHVNPHRQRYHCFGCGADGSAFDFVMAYEHVDFVTAVKRLAEKAGVPVIEEAASAEEDRKHRMRQRLLALHSEAADWFHAQLLESPEAEAARRYLKGRGIGSGVAKAWRIGYAPDSWDAFGRWAAGRGFSRAELLESGLVKRRDESDESDGATSYDRFRARVQFPICDEQGNVVGFSGRTLSRDAKEAKYVNSPETVLFSKSRILFGLHKSKRAIIKAGSAVVCEGQIDLITAFEAGVENVIASQGTAFTSLQARLLRRFAEEVVLCFDADAAGDKAAEKSLPMLMEHGFFVRVARMPPGHDPDSLIRADGYEAFLERVRDAPDFFDDMVERAVLDPAAATPRGKVAFARKLAEALSWVRDVAVRDAVLMRAAGRLQLPASDLRGMLAAPRPRREPGGPPAPAAAPAEKIEPAIATLCSLAMESRLARERLLAAPWREAVAEEADGGLLAAVLEGDFDPGDPVSRNAFLAGLDPEVRARLGGVHPLPVPASEKAVEAAVADCLRALRARAIRRRQESLNARLSARGLGAAEVLRIQKEILDLNKLLSDVMRPFP